MQLRVHGKIELQTAKWFQTKESRNKWLIVDMHFPYSVNLRVFCLRSACIGNLKIVSFRRGYVQVGS